jgi:tetratricopeptide (TPR) repeat protein
VRHLLLFYALAMTVLGGCSIPRVIIRQEYDLALREYERAAEMRNEWARPLVNLGNVLALQGDWSGAEKGYRKALRREPQNGEAMNNLAWVLCQAGKTEAALPWARNAVVSQPDEPAFLDTLAQIQIDLGDFDEARRTLDQALALAPPSALLQSLRQKRNYLEQASP